jgi:tRNA A-37 threonylcarbamoyl transferase component Bud32/streptogramin lyase
LSNAVQARDGTVWLGTPQGLFRFAGGLRAEYWTVREGPETPPWSFARVGERIYAGLVDQIVVLSADRRRWEPFVSPAGGDVTSLLATDDGTLLAATMYGGAGQYARDGRLLAHTEKNLPGGTSMRLAKGPAGDVWLGGNELGRLRREGTVLRFEKHFLSDQRHGNVLSVVSEDHTQKLWACYTGGVVVRDQDGSWREITTKNGLQANGCWSLAPLPNGDVWDAYDNQSAIGLIRPLAQSSIAVRQYGPESLPDAATVVLSPDALGRLWRGGGAASYAATPATAEAGNWLKLDGSDGLRPDMNSGSFFSDSDGSVWFGADNDIAHYSPPGDLLDPKFAPEVSISAFSWDGAAPRLAEGIGALPYAKNAVAHIGSLQFDRRNALKIRYRILPGQQNWQESKDLDVPLDSSKSGALSPGSHSLEVQGRVFTGPWSSTVRRNFVVLAPVWRTWPWIGAYVTGLALIVSGVVVMRRRRREEDALLMPDLAAARIGALLPDAEETQGITLDGRFEVGIMIARGGFANVMEGYDRESKQRCAIKVFRREVATKEWVQRRFEQEVAALQRIQHPNVVSIYAFGSIPTGAPYLVMEFIEGVDLRELLLTGPLPRPRIAGLLRQLGDALAAIHAQNICHRDITPENIIVRRPGAADEQPVLIDFSIAIVKDANETMYGLSRAAGTFDYMAPEQALGYAEPSSDIYGLTRVFVEMLTGRRMKALLPDAAIDLPQRLRHLLRELNCGLSEESLDLLASAQEFDPVKRPSDVSAFVRPVVRDLLSPGPGRPGNATT